MAAKPGKKPKPDDQHGNGPGTDVHRATKKFLRESAGLAKQLAQILDQYADAFEDPPPPKG